MVGHAGAVLGWAMQNAESEDAAAQRALDRWTEFPVHREPRPIVLVQLSGELLDSLRRSPRLHRQFHQRAVAEAELPDELRQDALTYCHDVQTGDLRPLAEIHRGEGLFGTDRGPRWLPAWLMYPPDRRWPFMGLDPSFAREHTWRPRGDMLSYYHLASEVTADGLTLTYRFEGQPTFYADYPTAKVYESDTAVVVWPVAVETVDPATPRLGIAHNREVVVTLQRPLGNRVLVTPEPWDSPEWVGVPRAVITGEPVARAD